LESPFLKSFSFKPLPPLKGLIPSPNQNLEESFGKGGVGKGLGWFLPWAKPKPLTPTLGVWFPGPSLTQTLNSPSPFPWGKN